MTRPAAAPNMSDMSLRVVGQLFVPRQAWHLSLDVSNPDRMGSNCASDTTVTHLVWAAVQRVMLVARSGGLAVLPGIVVAPRRSFTPPDTCWQTRRGVRSGMVRSRRVALCERGTCPEVHTARLPTA
jgi:hypothetical protein